MKAFALLPLALAASSPLMAADPLPHGSSATISNIVCKTVDLEPNDGVAPYAVLVNTPRTTGPYSVGGLLSGSGAQTVARGRNGAGLESIYITLDEQGSSGTAMLVPSGNGTVGLMSASSATAPGRVYDAYTFRSSYYPRFKIGPNSAVECKANYVITAWAKTATSAPDTAVSTAQVYAFEEPTGEGWNGAEVTAAANPAKGKRYGQKAGKLVLALYNFGGGERSVTGRFELSVDAPKP